MNRSITLKRIVYLSLILCLPFITSAQIKLQTIKGTVKDRTTKSPLAFATVNVEKSEKQIGTVTDENGNFILTGVPVGRQSIRCTYLGYATFLSEEFILTSAKETVINIELQEEIQSLSAVEVVASQNTNAPVNESAMVSTRSFSAEETERMPAGVNDLGRMAISYPGVTRGGDDTENDIIIRGNSSFGMLWRLEGIDIPNPNHFARPGTSGGGVTVFSAQLLSRSDFSTGGMSAEYGNALSGTFDVHFRKGNMEKREHRVKIGLLGLDFATEGPIKSQQASYLINYRYSTLGLLNKMGFQLIGERVSNDFQDLCFNLAYQSKDKKTFYTLFGMGGLSVENYTPVVDPLERKPGNANHWEDRIQGSNMGAVGFTLTRLINKSSFIKAVLSVNSSHIFRQYDTLSLKDERYRYNTQKYLEDRISTSVTYQKKLSDGTTWKSGIMFHQIFFDYNVETAPRRSLSDVTQQINNRKNTVFGNGSTQQGQIYTQISKRLNEKVTLQTGLHYLHFFLNNTSSIEPRAAISYKVAQNQTLNLAFSRLGKMLPLASYFYSQKVGNEIVQPNKDLRLIQANHLILSYQTVSKSQIKFSLEGYLQTLGKVPVELNTESLYWMLNNQDQFPEFSVVSKGRGLNYGLDALVEKFFSNKIYFLVTASTFRSQYSPFNQQWYNSKFNTRFTSSLTFGKEFTFRNQSVLQGGFRVLYNGGFRYSPIDPVLSAKTGQYVPLEGKEWTSQVTPYFRIDSRIAYRFNKKGFFGNLSLDIQNVTSHRNISFVSYDAVANKLNFTRFGGGFIPVLSFQMDF